MQPTIEMRGRHKMEVNMSLRKWVGVSLIWVASLVVAGVLAHAQVRPPSPNSNAFRKFARLGRFPLYSF